MKLAIICRPFSFHGGIQTATWGLMRELATRGYAIDLITTRAQPDAPGVRVRRLPVIAGPSLLRFVSFALAARMAVRGSRYDVVQSHERCLAQDIYRAGEGTHRGYLEAMGRTRARLQPFHRVVCAVEQRIFALATARHIAALSRRDKAEIEQRCATPSERVTVIYNGVDLERFHPDNRDRHRRPMRGELGLAPDDWVVLFVGSGFERKGLGALVDALGQARAGRWRLVVAGKGDADAYRRRAAALGIGDRITWLGPRPDVDRLYAMSDVVALPALYEPFGNVHLEALASGIPVLTSARAGGAEAVAHRRSGWVVREPTAELVADGLSALRDMVGPDAAGRARESAEPFTYGRQADAFTGLYRQLRCA